MDSPAPDDTTQNLARSAQQGDAKRFAELCERVAPSLVAWCELKVSGPLRESVDPLDVVQETWCRAWRRFPNFNADTTPFRAWTFRIAKNVVLECLRTARRQSGTPEGGSSSRIDLVQSAADSATALSRRLAREESIVEMLDWARGLDVEEYALFMHIGLEGLSYTEAGERLGLEKDTVAKRWQSLRARAARASRGAEYYLADG